MKQARVETQKWKPLSEEQHQVAHEKAIDQALHIDDKDERRTEIARRAVVAGAETALDLVSAWLVEQSPALHQKFLADFGK